ncbi:hypothetical protein M427DRAFT_38686 [Gonapodya prolifera JEL478]|uniref:Uncharacterized protein n=1 Tax=Gonapodya prolifera (strain JEL478) TaxID=1344416 RepID=A0A138ZZS6_GONPJ|nr:hypothetical protein M427DRAFT_38686 [Gonapodya prolifera JEL478]|eukprot:KXS09643.1 hypothetical protein M427DRAFT_38686 [Gonapodya prolifera JEL478]
MASDFGPVPFALCGAWHRVSLHIHGFLERSEEDDALWLLTPNCSATHRYPLTESGAGGEASDASPPTTSATKTGGRVAFFCDASYSPSTNQMRLVHVQDHRGVPREQVFSVTLEQRRFQTRRAGVGAAAIMGGKSLEEALVEARREFDAEGTVMVETGVAVRGGKECPYEEIWHRLPLATPVPFLSLREYGHPSPRQVLIFGPHVITIRDPLAKGREGGAFASRRWELVGRDGTQGIREISGWWAPVDGFGAKWRELREAPDIWSIDKFEAWRTVARGEDVMLGAEAWTVADVGLVPE